MEPLRFTTLFKMDVKRDGKKVYQRLTEEEVRQLLAFRTLRKDDCEIMMVTNKEKGYH